MGSTRLPGKVLRPIGHLPLLGHVIGRLLLLQHSAKTVVATSTLVQDDVIVQYCEAEDISCFRGSEGDVLARYFACASTYGFDHVVRLTADNPFTDMEELDRLIEAHLRNRNAFTHSFGDMPLGIGAEIFSMEALERSHREGHAAHHREHVDEYMIENPALFKTEILQAPSAKCKPELRLTVDTEDDWRLADRLVREAGKEWLTTERLIESCSPSA